MCPSNLAFGAILVTPDDPLTHAGDKLIEVASGKALVYISDNNNNGNADINDVVGISVSKGIRLTSFVDIHGDIVTNLTKKGTLNGIQLDETDLKDGSVLVKKANITELHIVAGTLGTSGNVLGEGIVEGQILATAGIGRAKFKPSTSTSSTLVQVFPIDIDGSVQVLATGTAAGGRDIFADVDVTIEGVHIGPVQLATVDAAKRGPSIGGVRIGAAEGLTLIQTGDAGIGGDGGSVFDIEIDGATTAFSINAGDGSMSNKAGDGGFLQNITITGSSVTGAILLRAGSGGDGSAKNGGDGGSVRNLALDGSGDYSVLGGLGGDGGDKQADGVKDGTGGNGGNLAGIKLEGGTSYNLAAGDGGDGGKSGGAGGFITDVDNSSSVSVSAPPTFILSADFDEDGSLDLLTLNALSDSMTVFLNDGEGNFEAGGTFTVGDNPQRATVVDLEGDGNLDVFVTNFGSSDVSVLFGNGDGTFDPAVKLDVGDGPVGIAVGQVNISTDTLLDIIVANSLDNTITILFGIGGGGFNSGSPTVINVGAPVSALTTGDLDVTLDLDIAVTSANTGSGADNVLLLLGNGPSFEGDGTFQPPQPFTVGNVPVDITNANVDGDSIPDLIVVNRGSDNVSVLLGGGGFPTISYQAAMNFSVGDNPAAVSVVNLDGGLPDLVVANSTDNSISVLLNTGGTFAAATTVAVGATPVSVTSGDFDGDFNQDVAVANTGSSNISLLFGKGDGTFDLAGEDTGGVTIRAGDGGNAENGQGGNGGFIGQDPSKPQRAIVDTDISIAAQGDNGAITIQAGSGGNGTTDGGRGAGIASILVTSTGAATIEAGAGGDGTTGKGGDGGFLGRGSSQTDVVINSGAGAVTTVVAGDGGDGATAGGLGGAISNSQVNSTDAVSVTTGDGGVATINGAGGSGGDVNDCEFLALPTLTIVTGRGGDSAGVNGGSGGSLTNSQMEISGLTDLGPHVFPPLANIALTMGDGGDAAGAAGRGGAGGVFKNSQVQMNVVTVPVGGGFVFANELAARIHTGSGGNGTIDGGDAGDLSSIEVLGIPDILFDPDFGIAAVDLYIEMGAGGDGGIMGGNGGSLTALTATGIAGDLEINNVFDGTNGAGGSGLRGGAGGLVQDVTGVDDLGLVGGTLTVLSGDGGAAASGEGGEAGEISNIRGNFQGTVRHHNDTLTSGVRLQGGEGGASATGLGGGGGTITGSNLTSLSNDIAFRAGDGGAGATGGGNGGGLSGMKANSSEALLFQAGAGGVATGADGVGGDGGDVSNLDQQGNPAQMIRQIVAGDGGAAVDLGGVGGSGGSISEIRTTGDIGDFTLSYGLNQMGGLFAGAGGIGAASDGVTGNVTDVTAGRIASIVAGTGAGPVAVGLVDNITANAIGANTDSDDPGEAIFALFDFHDTNGDGEFTLGADPSHDPSEAPIDGLIVADVIKRLTINGFTFADFDSTTISQAIEDGELPVDVRPLFAVEVSAPPPLGNVDPQP